MTNQEDRGILRKASLADVADISALTDAAYTKYIPRIGRKPQPMTADYAKMVVENSIWLLTLENKPVGLLVLVDEPEDLLIYSVAIQPEYQKQGFGRRLLDWAEQQAIQAGYHTIRLYTNERMEENIRLYKSIGYQETGREPRPGTSVVHMSKALGK